jgi:hypothetical protein
MANTMDAALDGRIVMRIRGGAGVFQDTFTVAKLASPTFMMSGPIGLFPAFAGLTTGADAGARRRIAHRAAGGG